MNQLRQRSQAHSEYIEQLEWPTHFSDLNPIENLRHYLKIQIHSRTLQNILELQTLCKDEWNKTSHKTCHSLVKNYRKFFLKYSKKKFTINQHKFIITIIWQFFFIMYEYFFHHQTCNNAYNCLN